MIHPQTQRPVKPLLLATCVLLCSAAFAKMPAPVLSAEAKAKVAEATAKTSWAGKAEAFQLCKAQDRVAAHAAKTAKAAGKDVKSATEAPACADPGTFAYRPS